MLIFKRVDVWNKLKVWKNSVLAGECHKYCMIIVLFIYFICVCGMLYTCLCCDCKINTFIKYWRTLVFKLPLLNIVFSEIYLPSITCVLVTCVTILLLTLKSFFKLFVGYLFLYCINSKRDLLGFKMFWLFGFWCHLIGLWFK